MWQVLLITLPICCLSMATECPASDKAHAQTKGSMMIQLDGELRRTVAEEDCVACCTSTVSERNASWQQTQNKSLSDGLGFLGIWNQQTEDQFAKCNATTTENVLSSSDEQLFISWGLVMALHPDYCSHACNGNAKATTILHEKLLQQIMESEKEAVGDMNSDIADDVGSSNSTQNLSGAALLQKASCSDGCYSGDYYSWGQGAAGRLCLTSSTSGTMRIFETTLATSSLGGNCNSINIKKYYSLFGLMSGGSGNCGAMGYIRYSKCIGHNKIEAYLNRSPKKVVVTKTSGLLQLAGYATDEKMSIDQLLDHPEHGPHAQDLLVDYYKDSIEAGESLIEVSRRDAQIQNHTLTLEHRHLERAMALHSQLPDADKKHNFMPIGYRLLVRL